MKTSLTLSIVALILAVAAAGAGGFALYKSYQPATPSVDNIVANNATNEVSNAPSNNQANQPKPSNNAPEPTGETYINPYLATLPDGWTATETTVTDMPTCPMPQNVTTFADADFVLNVTVGVRKIGDDVSISCRTGVGAGEFLSGDKIDVASTKVPGSYLTYQDVPYEVFVGSDATTFELDGYELNITISQTSNDPTGIDITELIEYDQALELLASINLPLEI